MFIPMNVNGIPYTTDYMQYYRPQSHQVRFCFGNTLTHDVLNYLFKILNLGRTTNR